MGGELFERLLGGNLISTQTALVRRSLLTACGDFDDRFAPLEDWECFIRLSRLTTWAFLPEALVDAPYSSDSISLNNERWIAALTLLLKEYSAEFTARPRLLSRHWSTLAHRHYLAGRPAIARRLYLQAFRKNPSRVTSAIAAFLTTLPPLYRALTSSAH